MTMSYEIVTVYLRLTATSGYEIEPVYLRLTATSSFRIYHRFYDRQRQNIADFSRSIALSYMCKSYHRFGPRRS